MKTVVQLVGSDRLPYIEIGMLKNKFYVCTLDRDGKVLSTTECNNDLIRFKKFVDYIKVIETLVKQKGLKRCRINLHLLHTSVRIHEEKIY